MKMQTLQDWTTENPDQAAAIWSGLEVDQPTQTNINNFFLFRYVCDPLRYAHYMRRALVEYLPQYNLNISLEAIQWDPMVADYMERQHKHQINTKRTASRTDTTTHQDSTSTEESGQTSGTSTSNTHTTNASESGKTTDTTTSTQTATQGRTAEGGSDSRTSRSETVEETAGTSKGTTSGSSTATGMTSVRAGSTVNMSTDETGHDVRSDSGENYGEGYAQRLNGQTPDSSTYGAPGTGLAATVPPSLSDIYTPPGSGFPNALNWTYTSAQDESRSGNSGANTSNGTTDTTRTGTTDTTTNANSDTDTDTHTAQQAEEARSTTGTRSGTTDTTDATNYGRTQDSSTQGTESGTVAGTEKETAEGFSAGTQNASTSGTTAGTSSSKGSSTGTTTGQTDDTTAGSGEEKERYAGRHEAPQELIDRAVTYVRRSKSFEWLVGKLNSCFSALLDEDGGEVDGCINAGYGYYW